MTAQLAPLAVQKFCDNNGNPLFLGQLSTFVAGTTTPQATYVDSTQTTPNTNPIILNFRGECNLWLDPAKSYKLVLKDQAGNLIWTVDNVAGGFGANSLSASLIPNPSNTFTLGSPTNSWANAYLGPNATPAFDSVSGNIGYYARTQPEITAGVVPLNFIYPPGTVDRYGTNTTPGTTDMSAALQAAVNLALATVGAGKSGIPARFLNNAYSIVTPPTFGAATTAMLPIDIGGTGLGTQIINAAAANKPTFDFTGKNGWYLHDLLLTGTSANKNDGVHGATSGTAEQIRWRIERVISMVAGHGFYIFNTNTGVIRDCKHWPDNPPALQVAQAVTTSDIGHGIYLTGSFAHNISVYDFDGATHTAYATGQRAIKCDATVSSGLLIQGGVAVGETATNAEFGLELANLQAWKISGLYNENCQIKLTNCVSGLLDTAGTTRIGGGITITSNSQHNTFIGYVQKFLQLGATAGDNTCFGNTFLNCEHTDPASITDFSDAVNLSNPPNKYINCSIQSAVIADRGMNYTNVLTYSHAMAPDAYNGKTLLIRVSDNFNFNISWPLHPSSGLEVTFMIRNEVPAAGAMGAAPTISGGPIPGWVSPANGFHRNVKAIYSGFFAAWQYDSVGTVDLPN